MSTTKKELRAPEPAVTSKPDTSMELRVERAPDETREELVAKMALGPIALNSLTALTYSQGQFGTIELGAAYGLLEKSVKAAQGGDLSGAEAVLMSQAIALNAIFNDLAMRSHEQSQMKNLDTFLRLAMKAQSQCRMTLETLAAIKSPPVVFARQANIAHGHQQVNNGVAPGPASRAAKMESSETELLEASDGKRLDSRATSTAGGADPQMETVGAVHRTAHR